jgi:hypothetical protein
MDSLVAYLVAAMIGWVPLHVHAPAESIDDARARYESIARDAIAVAFDESESPLFSGPEGRTQTALLMLSVASYESGYRVKVDDGRGLGDHGHSYCLMQVRVGTGVTREGWTGHDLVSNRQLCFRAGLHIARSSFGACHALAVDDRLSAYASGHCFADAAVSRTRVGRARTWREGHAPPKLTVETTSTTTTTTSTSLPPGAAKPKDS